jgi:hypothetical protein
MQGDHRHARSEARDGDDIRYPMSKSDAVLGVESRKAATRGQRTLRELLLQVVHCCPLSGEATNLSGRTISTIRVRLNRNGTADRRNIALIFVAEQSGQRVYKEFIKRTEYRHLCPNRAQNFRYRDLNSAQLQHQQHVAKSEGSLALTCAEPLISRRSSDHSNPRTSLPPVRQECTIG